MISPQEIEVFLLILLCALQLISYFNFHVLSRYAVFWSIPELVLNNLQDVRSSFNVKNQVREVAKIFWK